MILSQEVIRAREQAQHLPIYAFYSLISPYRWELITVEPYFLILSFKDRDIPVSIDRLVNTLDPWVQALDIRGGTIDITLIDGINGETLAHQMAYLDWLQHPHRASTDILVSYRDDETEIMSMPYKSYAKIRHLERTLSCNYPLPSQEMLTHPLWTFYQTIEGHNWSMTRNGTFQTNDPVLLHRPMPPTHHLSLDVYRAIEWMELTLHPWRTDFPWDGFLVHHP